MGKTSSLTGTGKKNLKKVQKAQGTLAEISVEQAKHGEKYRKSSQHDLRQIAKGKGIPKYEHLTLHGQEKDLKRAGKGAEAFYAPIKEQAIKNFDQYTMPEVSDRYGRESGGGSSALNQAMAAARGNLQSQLASDFAGYKTNMAQNMLNQREQSRQFGNQSQMQNLNARMQALGSGMGQQIQPSFQPMQSQYLQKQQEGSSGIGGSLIAGGLGALGSWAGSGAGSAAIAGMFSSREVKENIKAYEKGLDVVRELDVKQYDYTIPVEGRRTDRVGLIAEDVPEEIQAMIGTIKGVDVYGLVALLVNCVKQLDEKVKILEAA
jgi:hypothetical protein